MDRFNLMLMVEYIVQSEKTTKSSTTSSITSLIMSKNSSQRMRREALVAYVVRLKK